MYREIITAAAFLAASCQPAAADPLAETGAAIADLGEAVAALEVNTARGFRNVRSGFREVANGFSRIEDELERQSGLAAAAAAMAQLDLAGPPNAVGIGFAVDPQTGDGALSAGAAITRGRVTLSIKGALAPNTGAAMIGGAVRITF